MNKYLEAAEAIIREWLETTECDVCCNAASLEEIERLPDGEYWTSVYHGKGCYVVNEDGGGSTSVDVPPAVVLAQLVTDLSEMLTSDVVKERERCNEYHQLTAGVSLEDLLLSDKFDHHKYVESRMKLSDFALSIIAKLREET